MTLNVKTTGFINFNKKYNKTLDNGAVTVSVAHGVKQQDGTFKNEYINGRIPAKLVPEIKPLINEKLVDIEGVLEQNNGYTNLVILKAKEHQKTTQVDELGGTITDEDLPF